MLLQCRRAGLDRYHHGELAPRPMASLSELDLKAEWERSAEAVRACAIRERLPRWALDWAGRLDQTEHLEEASSLLRTVQAELGTSMATNPPADLLLIEAASRQCTARAGRAPSAHGRPELASSAGPLGRTTEKGASC
jgi:hypothetical protein